MSSLIFLITVLALVVLFIRTIIRLVRHQPVRQTVLIMSCLVAAYGTGWSVFKMTQKLLPVPMGTQVCFDDWCATANKAEQKTDGDSIALTLHLEMFNNAQRIAQTPSEPRVHIIDAGGHAWSYSERQQLAYEKQNGAQPGIGHRLDVHQSMETVLVFALPKNATGLKALMEEGPWITNLLFPEDQQVFLIR